MSPQRESRQEMESEIIRLESALKDNPMSSLRPAIEHRINVLKKKLEAVRISLQKEKGDQR
jgi:hypothetical protein